MKLECLNIHPADDTITCPNPTHILILPIMAQAHCDLWQLLSRSKAWVQQQRTAKRCSKRKKKRNTLRSGKGGEKLSLNWQTEVTFGTLVCQLKRKPNWSWEVFRDVFKGVQNAEEQVYIQGAAQVHEAIAATLHYQKTSLLRELLIVWVHRNPKPLHPRSL